MRSSAGIMMLVMLGACDSDNMHYKVSCNPSATGNPYLLRFETSR